MYNIDQNSLPYLGSSLHTWFAQAAGNKFTPVSSAPVSRANSLNHLCKLLPKYGREF